MSTYTTVNPPLDIYNIVPTGIRSKHYEAHFAFDTSRSITGTSYENSWMSEQGQKNEQRINVNMNISCIIRRLRYVNYHDKGGDVNDGAQYFQFYGANSNIMYDPYNRSDNLTILYDGILEKCEFYTPPESQPPLQPPIWHPIYKTIDIDNYAYFTFYAIKMWNNWYGNCGIGLRRFEIQAEDGIWP